MANKANRVSSLSMEGASPKDKIPFSISGTAIESLGRSAMLRSTGGLTSGTVLPLFSLAPLPLDVPFAWGVMLPMLSMQSYEKETAQRVWNIQEIVIGPLDKVSTIEEGRKTCFSDTAAHP